MRKRNKRNSNRNHFSCSLRHTTRAYLKEKTQQKNANGSRHVNEQMKNVTKKNSKKVVENDNQMLAAQMFKQN